MAFQCAGTMMAIGRHYGFAPCDPVYLGDRYDITG